MFAPFFQRKAKKEKGVTKDELISFLAHEFRTPLSLVTLYLGLLKEKNNAMSRENKKYLEEISKGVLRIHKLTDVLYALAKTDVAALAESGRLLDPRDAIEKAFAKFKQERNDAHIEKKFDTDVPSIHFSEQLLMALLLHFMRETSQAAGNARTLAAVLRREEDRIIIKISGARRKKGGRQGGTHSLPQAELFSHNTGLEVYCAKLECEHAGGKLWVEQGSDFTAVFCFSLPINVI